MYRIVDVQGCNSGQASRDGGEEEWGFTLDAPYAWLWDDATPILIKTRAHRASDVSDCVKESRASRLVLSQES